MSQSPDLNRCEQSEVTTTLKISPACEPEARGQLSGKRFLVVEDNFLVALNMAAGLEDAGAEVTWTGVAEEAVHAIEARPLDAVLLNGTLRGKPVDEIAAALTRLRVPFLFATGYARENLPQSFRKVALLSKPFTRKQLLAAAAGLVDRRADGFDDVRGTCSPLGSRSYTKLDAAKTLEPPGGSLPIAQPYSNGPSAARATKRSAGPDAGHHR
jgi:CheY-like chemotaxis protein